MAIFKIHPGIGIARLGNSPDEFCISPEEPAALPLASDSQGNPLLSPDGLSEVRVNTFKDGEGRIKRQAARFQVWAYDEQSPEGRPLKLGDPVSGGGNDGVLIDIQWRVYVANKKSSWYEFRQLDGEHGYASGHPRRNADITDAEARQQLIIDPGPRSVDCSGQRAARFDRDGGGVYAATFPPPLEPCSIDTLGRIMTDDTGRLLVLGGHGHSGTFKAGEFGQPRIDTYANNDGWFDDTADGPVTARLVMYSKLVGQIRFVDVQAPAWVVVGYPAYVPQILDMVTMEDLLQDLAICQFAARTDLYGEAGTFGNPQVIDPSDTEALIMWRAGRLTWNAEHRPWFYRDIWPILFRPDEYTYLTSVLGQSNFPHNQSPRGNFDPYKLSVPPQVDRHAVQDCERECLERHESGDLFVESLLPVLAPLETRAEGELALPAHALHELLAHQFADDIRGALSTFARALRDQAAVSGTDVAEYLRDWRTSSTKPGYPKAKEDLERAVNEILARLGPSLTEELNARLRSSTLEHMRRYETGQLLDDCRRKCVEANTHDPYRAYRRYLFDLLRQPGEENHFRLDAKASSRVHNLPLMPLLAGDNPISNSLPSKFLRLTDYQFFLLRQWALGRFYNEEMEGWAKPDPWQPYAGWVNRTGRDLDRGVLSNLLGGAFCPGGEIGWIMRNPAIYAEPYRLKADPEFYNFRLTAGQANANRGSVPESDYASYVGDPLSQDNDFDGGLQPGDLTKYMALPWQADFNECSIQDINITYQEWNRIYPDSDGDSLMKREQQVWDTLWWPAHRPMQTWEISSITNGNPSYIWVDWSRGIPQTNAGDLRMVTEWWKLGFVRQNPFLPQDVTPTEMPPDNKYISVERTAPGSAWRQKETPR